METLLYFIPENLGKALGWMVLHSIWQAAAIALVAGIVLIAQRRRSARLRYWTANGALATILMAAVITFAFYYQQPVDLKEISQMSDAHSAGMETLKPGNIAQMEQPATIAGEISGQEKPQMSTYFNQHLPLIVALWFLGICVFMLRLLGNIGYIYYLKSHLNFPVESYWDELLEDLLGKARLKKPVHLVESALVRTPMMLGYLKPVILFPIGMINRLDPENVEAILAHELAHILHHDYLFNMLQSIVETLFYYHPAVWWLSSRIRHEREIAADDAAVVLTGNSIGYAKSLVLVQDLALSPLSPSLAFAGRQKNQLLHRVRHILNIKQSTNLAMEKIIGTCAIVLLLIGLGYAQNRNTTQNDFHYTETATSGGPLSGIWEGKIENDQVCINLSSRTEHSSWMNGDCYKKAEFSALPTTESEFTLTRPAGTITFKGKFENNEGYGRFRFAPDQTFSSWLTEQGITGIEDQGLVHLFFANIDKEYVLSLKKAGYKEISGEDLQNMAIHGLSADKIAAYRDMSKSLGEKEPSLETMLSLSIQDVDLEFMKSLQKAGFSHLSMEDVMNAKIHDLSPEYVKQVKDMGFKNMTFDDVLNFKIQDVTPEFLNDLKKSGITPESADEALNLKIHEVSPESVAEFKKMGFKDLSTEDIMNLKIHDITPEFLAEMQKAGFSDLSAEDAMNLKIQDVTPAFVQEMHKAGFDNLSPEDAANLKIQDISVEYVQNLEKAGFKNLSMDDVVNAKVHDIDPADLVAYEKLGFKDIDLDDAISVKIHEVTPEFIENMRKKGFKDLQLEEYIDLKVQYGDRIRQ